MKTVAISNYIFYGTCFRYLQDVPEGVELHGDGRVIYNIKKFISGLDTYELPVTRRASYELEALGKELEKEPIGATLSSNQHDRLHELISQIRPTFNAETMGRETYVITEKKLRVDKLLYDIGGLFGNEVYDLLSTITKYDFNEAGKCIAFNRATAAAFHLLRGTESVLREYYCYLVKNRRIKPLLWRPILRELEKKRKHNSTLLKNLDNICESFRNPTDHPEKIYDMDEVQDLFGLCIDVVNRMIKEIHITK